MGLGTRFGTARLLAQARAAELRGELAQAAALFAQAGHLEEAARVMVLRGDAEADAAARLRHYVQAVATAPEGTGARAHARRKQASQLLLLAGDGAALRQDLLEAARELESLGQPASAAEAYARAGDLEGEARCLAAAGQIERLDALLAEQHAKDHEALARREALGRHAMLADAGRRREAVEVARASADEALRERGRAIEARRAAGDVVRVVLAGRPLEIVLGQEVTIGRAATATIPVASAALSRRHLAVARSDAGPIVRELGSRNRTTLRGLDLAGEAPVGEGLELRLGGEVPLVVRPAPELPGAVAIEVAGRRCIAPLGPCALGVGAWRLERGSDGWIELTTDDDPPAFAGALQLASRVTLLSGDALARERRGEPVLVVEA